MGQYKMYQVIYVSILTFANIKNNNENKEKHLEISLFYTCVPTFFMIWSTVPDI